MPPSGVHWLMTLLGMSLNRRKPPLAPFVSLRIFGPSFTHTGPSVHSNPSASFSSLASLGTSASKAGSSRSTFPSDGYSFAAAAASDLALALAARSDLERHDGRTRKRISTVALKSAEVFIAGEGMDGSAGRQLRGAATAHGSEVKDQHGVDGVIE